MDNFLYVTNEVVGGNGGELIVYNNQNPAQPVEVFRSSLAHSLYGSLPQGSRKSACTCHYSPVSGSWISPLRWPVESDFLIRGWVTTAVRGVYDTSPFYPSGIATASDLGNGLYVYSDKHRRLWIVRGNGVGRNNGRIPLAGARCGRCRRTLRCHGRRRPLCVARRPGPPLRSNSRRFAYVTKTRP